MAIGLAIISSYSVVTGCVVAASVTHSRPTRRVGRAMERSLTFATMNSIGRGSRGVVRRVGRRRRVGGGGVGRPSVVGGGRVGRPSVVGGGRVGRLGVVGGGRVGRPRPNESMSRFHRSQGRCRGR